ncbi:unnamed protein product [Discosporangium mesarthrocarpum]
MTNVHDSHRHMSAEQTSEQNAMMDRLSPESIDTIVGFVNRMPEDVIAYTMGFSELGEIARKKNAFTAGSFVMESAKITALDGEGMDVVAKIRERSFFGKVRCCASYRRNQLDLILKATGLSTFYCT